MLRKTTFILAAAAALAVSATAAQAVTVYGITTDNTLFSFDSSTPSTLTSGRPVTGLGVNESLRGIDFRPSTGQLYGLGSSGQLYTINLSNGAASTVGAANASMSGTAFGFDFNPQLDLIRVTSNTGANFVLNPNGTLNATGTNLAFAAGDPNFGTSPNVVGSAYSNNFNGTGSTQLYAIDSGVDVLATQNNNGGVLNTVGVVHLPNTSELVGFDIASTGPGNNTAYASLTPVGGVISNFYIIDLGTGLSGLVGQIDGGTLVADIAVAPIPEPTSLGLAAIAGLGLLARARRRA